MSTAEAAPPCIGLPLWLPATLAGNFAADLLQVQQKPQREPQPVIVAGGSRGNVGATSPGGPTRAFVAGLS